MQQTAFQIFNASAGSGKTFTLVKEYLKIILSPGNKKGFRQILAITFTNKAVAEMKQRILSSLYQFSTHPPSSNRDPLFLSLCDELSCSPETLHEEARTTLRYILHNYAFFDVSTIDKFTHRVIRTFSRDLKLPSQFEVVLEVNLLMQEVVGRLLDKAVKDPELTQTLVDFSLEKIEEDKSWDISYDLNEVGMLLFDENHLKPLQKLQIKSSKDFKQLKSKLIARISQEQKQMKDAASEVLDLIETHGLTHQDFKRGYFPKFIQQIYRGEQGLNFDAAWKQNFGNEPLYSQKVSEDKQALLDELLSEFTRYFLSIRAHFFAAARFKNAYSNLVPLAILKALKQELDLLCDERELLPISSFNRIIAAEIKDQPAPYIYERIGEKYRHYFIDEFQDTSELQWNNLVPLISNALEGQDESGLKGSLLLVGDAKQAIYRWRGGKAEQFLNLLNPSTDIFTVPPEIHLLPTNYRSHEKIVEFNNEFFRITSPILSNPYYEALFNNQEGQLTNKRKGGQVVLEFIENKDQEIETQYGRCIEAYIQKVLQQGFRYQDICILTRKIKHGIQAAEYLISKGIPVISSETLLLNSSEEVRFAITLLDFGLRPDELQSRFEMLRYLRQRTEKGEWSLINDLGLFQDFLISKFGFDWGKFQHMNAYDALEYGIARFKLAPDSDAYLNFLLDEAQRIAQKEGPGIAIFLSIWEKRKEKLSIVAPEGLDAVKVMTIHKAKGLEFPVVIFPYANSYIYEEKNPKLWADVPSEDFCGFDTLLFSKKKEMIAYDKMTAGLYAEEQAKLELDTFNLLYVALTRSICALYIITEYPTKKDFSQPKYYSDLFVQYLQNKGLWDTATKKFTFGSLPEKTNKEITLPGENQYHIPYIYSDKPALENKLIPKKGGLWDPGQEKALAWGNLFHDLMAQIHTISDIPEALTALAGNPILEDSDLEILEKKCNELVTHPALSAFFQTGTKSRNETEIITENGLILRPDRMVFREQEVWLLDYKTGKQNEKDREQLLSYGDALQKMGFQVMQKVLVYTQKKIEPIFI
ncbi:MAG: UvrD-helicase domain-containing protein [Eudoraea sp.]|nr:UvrD-helicase domain-containing protein [Eudoraea sp.]